MCTIKEVDKILSEFKGLSLDMEKKPLTQKQINTKKYKKTLVLRKNHKCFMIGIKNCACCFSMVYCLDKK